MEWTGGGGGRGGGEGLLESHQSTPVIAGNALQLVEGLHSTFGVLAASVTFFSRLCAPVHTCTGHAFFPSIIYSFISCNCIVPDFSVLFLLLVFLSRLGK